MGYKVILNYGDKHTALKGFSLPHFSKTMKNSYVLITMPERYVLISHGIGIIFVRVDRTHHRLQNDTKF